MTLRSVLPALTVTKTQGFAYLLGVALFSISFLVFLNASISFVVTDVIGRKSGVGDVVGTLGFADELLALAACPLWGILSDRVGVRNVATMGFAIIGVSLMLLVQSHNVYPQLLLARLAFSIGGAACSTMVTAILPAMTRPRPSAAPDRSDTMQPVSNVRNSGAFSISSELTITPARYEVSRPQGARRGRQLNSTQNGAGPNSRSAGETEGESPQASSQLAGWVGMFTGVGALLAVAIFLRLPAVIGENGVSQAGAVKDSFYIVGAIALLVGILVFFGLRDLPGEEGKGLRNMFVAFQTPGQKDHPQDSTLAERVPSYFELVRAAIILAFTDSSIALGYLGGFVARASSVGISLFIPLFVNAYYIRNGLCTKDPNEDIKSNCRDAYVLASMLTGFSQLAALLCAPFVGWFAGAMSKRAHLTNLPLGLGAVVGIVGCVAFGMLDNPNPFSEHEPGRWAILAVILLGFSQIIAIVCSLGLLSRGIQNSSAARTASAPVVRPDDDHEQAPLPSEVSEITGLLQPPQDDDAQSPALVTNGDRTHLKGTIAGVYSLAGGVGILLLTKLGGVLFDRKSPGAPFYMLAGFNGLLLVAVLGITLGQHLRRLGAK